jgi:hypothetical protein
MQCTMLGAELENLGTLTIWLSLYEQHGLARWVLARSLKFL